MEADRALIVRPVPDRPNARLLVAVGAMEGKAFLALRRELEWLPDKGVSWVLLLAEQATGLARADVINTLRRTSGLYRDKGGAIVIVSREDGLAQALDGAGLGEAVPVCATLAEGAARLKRGGPQQVALPAALVEVVERSRAPCAVFEEVGAGPDDTGCRLGGRPLLAPGRTWPRSPEGPLTFVGQLDFAALPSAVASRLPGLPSDGVLAVFYDAEADHRPIDAAARDHFQLAWCPSSDAATPCDPPARPLGGEVPLTGLRARSGSSVPHPDVAGAAFGLDAAAWAPLAEPYTAWREQLLRQSKCPRRGHQLLGHPDASHEDELRAELAQHEGGAWRLLWQVALDRPGPPVYGTLYVLVRDTDLAGGQLEQGWVALRGR